MFLRRRRRVAYAVTPVIAAAAGANVTVLAKSTKFGSVQDIRNQVLSLAKDLHVEQRIEIVDSLTTAHIARADIVTNSGHLRPLDARFIREIKPGAAIPLMYESWELRPAKSISQPANSGGIRVAGTNERHPHIGVFDYLGILALFGLLQCRIPVCFSRILLICDNRFAPYIAKTLVGCGAKLDVFVGTELPDSLPAVRRATTEPGAYDAVVLAATPGLQPIIGRAGSSKYTREQIGTFRALVQIWGDLDRSCLSDVLCYPATEPRQGHMGILLSEIGPEPIIRLQAGGLKVGEILVRRPALVDESAALCQPVVV